jgi:excisionase family DNA binding protein
MTSEEMMQQMMARLERIEKLTLIGAKNTLDLQEAVLYTGYSEGHIYRLTSERRIPHFKESRKLYFDKKELDAWMQKQRVLTVDEIDSKASTYVATH